MMLYKYMSVMWIAVFSSAYKLFTNNWYPCVLIYMISSDATTHFKFINCTRDRACGHAIDHMCPEDIRSMVMLIHTWGHMWGYVRQNSRTWIILFTCNRLLIDYFNSIVRQSLPFELEQSKFEISHSRRANHECFPANYIRVLQPWNFSTSNNLQYTVWLVPHGQTAF